MKYLSEEPFGIQVPGCRDPGCKTIFGLCWICGYCQVDHCTCLDEALEGPEETHESREVSGEADLPG